MSIVIRKELILKFLLSVLSALLILIYSHTLLLKNAFASTNWPDNRFATAGVTAPTLGDPYYYIWDNMSDPIPPDQASVDHAFFRIVGKLDNRHDGLSCNTCDQTHIDQIFAAEQPKIIDLLSRDLNKGGVWVVGNESNYYPLISPQLHAYQYQRYHALIKSLDPSAKLANSGILLLGAGTGFGSTEGTSYLNTFLTSLDPSIWPDIYNIHLYPNGVGQSIYDNSAQQARDVRNFLNSKGETVKPVWVTEMGFFGTTDLVNVKAFMATLIDSFVYERTADRWFWFIGSWEPGYDSTALTRNGQPTELGNFYRSQAQFYATNPAPFTISNVTVTNIKANSATFNWTTSRPATSQVNYGTTNPPSSLNPEDPQLVTQHSMTISLFSRNTTYYYRVISKDERGLIRTSPISTFKTARR